MCQTAPPHVACSGIHDGADLEFFWNLLWVNPIPDAVSRVKIEVNGTNIEFEGIGYHDKASCGVQRESHVSSRVTNSHHSELGRYPIHSGY